MKLEKLENRIAFNVDTPVVDGPVAPPGLDTDSPVLESPVFGPAIPEHLDYTPPPVLMRPADLASGTAELIVDYIENTPVESVSHPIIEDGFIDNNYIWDTDLDNLFRLYADDGEITVREARDLLVDSDDGGYISRFEVWQTINYIYNEDFLHLYNRASQVLLTSATTNYSDLFDALELEVDATHLSEGLHSVQPAADYWWNATRQAEV